MADQNNLINGHSVEGLVFRKLTVRILIEVLMGLAKGNLVTEKVVCFLKRIKLTIERFNLDA